jgi:hypothetical protein
MKTDNEELIETVHDCEIGACHCFYATMDHCDCCELGLCDCEECDICETQQTKITCTHESSPDASCDKCK